VLTAGARDALARDSLVRLAHHGYVALAAELPAPSADRPSADERAAVDAGVEGLFRADAVSGARVGVLAFGRAGLPASDGAGRGAGIGAGLALDAGFEPAALDGALARVDAFVLAIFAEKSAGVAHGDAAELERRLRAEQVPAEVRIQPGA